MRTLGSILVACALVLTAISAMAQTTATATLTIYPGENWISVPLVPIDPDPQSVFAGCNIDGNLTELNGQTTVVYSSADPDAFGAILLGSGYEIDNPTSAPETVSYTGLPDGVPSIDSNGNVIPGSMTDMYIGLPGAGNNTGGMNWVGQPFDHSMSVDCMVLTNGQQTLSIAQAVSEGWIAPLWLGFNNETQSTFTVGASVFDPDQDYFAAGQMYQITTLKDNLALIVPAYAPEPSGLTAMMSGLGLLAWRRRRDSRAIAR